MTGTMICKIVVRLKLGVEGLGFLVAFSKLLIVVLIAISMWMLTSLVNNWQVLPYWDHWEATAAYQDWVVNGPNISKILEPHNEHRIVLSKVLFLMDYSIFGGKQTFLYLCNLLFSVAIYALLFLGASEVDTTKKVSQKLLMVALALFFGVHLVQAVNLNWAFQSQFFLVPLNCLVAILLMHKFSGDVGRVWHFILSLLFGALAVFSMANGLVVPFILLLAMWSLRVSWRYIFIAAMFYALVYAAFLYDYHPVHEGGDDLGLFEKLDRFWRFLVYYLTNPFLTRKYFVVRVLAFSVSLLPLIYVFYKVLMRRSVPKVVYTAVLMALFCGLTASMTAYGRVSFGSPELGLSDRYTTIGLLYWVCVLMVAFHISPYVFKGLKFSPLVLPTLLTVFGVTALGALSLNVRTPLDVVHQRYVNAQLIAELRSEDMLPDIILKQAYPNVELARTYINFLYDNKLGAFSMPLQYKGASPIPFEGELNGQTSCTHSIDSMSVEWLSEVRLLNLRGWGFSPVNPTSPTEARLVGDLGQTLSSRFVFQKRPGVRRAFDLDADIHGFAGFGKIAPAATDGNVLLFVNKEFLCHIPLNFSVYRGLKATKWSGPMLEMRFLKSEALTVDFIGQAHKDAVFDGVLSNLQAVCPAGALVGTRINRDADTGAVKYTLPDTMRAEVKKYGLSFITGPTAEKLFVDVEYVDGKLKRFALPVSPTLSSVHLEDLGDVRNIEAIQLIDEGAGWGQWLGSCGFVIK